MLEKTLFDGDALIRALDARRAGCDLDWNQLADELHEQSSELNAELGGNCMCSGALVRTAKRGTMSCQYAMIILRWLGRPPEDFLKAEPVHVGDTRLPDTDAAHRLRWDLPALHAALDEHRRDAGLTWAGLARELGCSPSRLTNLRTARLADMDLVMRVTQRLRRPAARFVRPARW